MLEATKKLPIADQVDILGREEEEKAAVEEIEKAAAEQQQQDIEPLA